MIALQSDCLLFQLASGESIPCSPEMISVELIGDSSNRLDPEMLRHAAASVFHYFKTELNRETVTIGEFSIALEKALRNLGLHIRAGDFDSRSQEIIETDLGLFARQSDGSLELFFFRACATNCGLNFVNHHAWCAFADCAAASSNSPARNAGAIAAKKCRSKSLNICAVA